jgi:glyoxylate reductase
MSKHKPVVVVTRKLPQVVETRMMELFQTKLNATDQAMGKAELIEAVKTADVLVPTVTDRIDKAILMQAGEQLKLIANFCTGVDNIDVETAVARGITVTNTPGVLTEDTADMTMALIMAVSRRLIEGSKVIGSDNTWQGWSPTWMLGSRLWGKRIGIIGMGRIGTALAAVRGKRLRLQSIITTATGSRQDRRGTGSHHWTARPDAGADGHHLGQLPAHTGHLSSALGAAAETDEKRRDYRQHFAGRSH